MSKISVVNGLLIAAALLVISFATKMAAHTGWITEDMAIRLGQCATGLSLAFMGNYMPKAVSSGPKQLALRVGGWCFALAGLAYAVLSLVAPKDIGDDVSIAVVAVAVIITVVFGLWACTRPRATAAPE